MYTEKPAAFSAADADRQRKIIARKKAEHARLALEQMISEISTRFLNLPWHEIDVGINDALEIMGMLAGVDRSYLFLLFDGGKKARNTHEWCAPGVIPQIQNLQDVALTDLKWIHPKILAAETVYIPRVAALPGEAAAEKAMMQEQDIQSMLVVPLTSAGRVLGFLGFDAVKSEKIWADEDVRMLHVVGEIIVSAQQRQQTEQALQESEARLRAIGNALPDIVFVIDEDGRFVDILTSADNMTFLAADKLKGQRFHEVFSPALADRFLQAVHETITTGQSQLLECDLHIPAGHRWFEARTAPLPLKIDGKNCTVFIARDITDRKRADELQNQNLYLQEELRNEMRYGEMLGASAAMQKVFHGIERVAATNSTVLLLGETGTGKELIGAPFTI